MCLKTKDRHFWLFQNFHFPFSVMVSLIQYQQMKILLITWPPEKRFYLKCTGIGYETILIQTNHQAILKSNNVASNRTTNNFKRTQHYDSPKIAAMGRGSEDDSSKKINVRSLAISSFDFDAWQNSWGHRRTDVAWRGAVVCTPTLFKRKLFLWMGQETIFHKNSRLDTRLPQSRGGGQGL